MLELIVCKSANPSKATPLLFIHGAWHGIGPKRNNCKLRMTLRSTLLTINR
jgi:hypothetical protein